MIPGNHPLYLPLSALISDLKEQGFVIGVDNWQDVYLLLRKGEFDQRHADPFYLKTVLCPLFAVNEEQQKIFYRLFDRHFAPVTPPENNQQPAAPVFSPQKELRKKERQLVITYSSLGTALLFITWFIIRTWFFYHPLTRPIEFRPAGPQTPITITFPPPQPDETQTDTARAPVTPPAESSLVPLVPLFDPDPSWFEMHDYWKYRFRTLLVEGGLWLVLGGSSIWGLILLYRRQRRKMIRTHQHTRDPLSYWPVRTEDHIHVQLPHEFYQAANSLRRRLPVSTPVIDMPATVMATIRAGGRPAPVFRQRSRPAEYLVLLPDDNAFAMFTQYCDFLFAMLGKTDIILHRYYYRDAPVQFYAHSGEKPSPVPSLLYHHGNARLLLVMHPQEAEKYADLIVTQFGQWEDRALLLSAPMQQGTAADAQLRETFRLYPASVKCLERLVEQWEAGQETDDTYIPDPPQPFISRFEALKPQLLRYFEACRTGSPPEELLRWLTACCFFPELHWELVLFTGQQLKGEKVPLLRLENLEALCRIIWFASGSIPAEVRDTLTGDRTIFSDEEKDRLVQAISELIHRNMPEEELSLAHDRRKMHLALLDTMLSQSEISRRKRLRRLMQAGEKTGEDDELAALLLKREMSNFFSRMLPEKVQQQLYREGKNYRGWKAAWSSLLLAVVATVILLLIDFRPVTGNLEVYNGKGYFIDNAEKQAVWQNHLASFYYNPYYPGGSVRAHPSSLEHRQAGALLDSASAVAPGETVAQLNQFIRKLNYQLILLNEEKAATAATALRSMEKDLASLEQAEQSGSYRTRPDADSLTAHLARARNHYSFARWLAELAAGNRQEAERLFKNVKVELLDEKEKKLLEERRK